MHAGREIKLRRGALAGCAPPMAIGVLIAIWLKMTFFKTYDLSLETYMLSYIVSYPALVLLCIPPLTCLGVGIFMRRTADPIKLKSWRRIFCFCLSLASFIQCLFFISLTAVFAYSFNLHGNPTEESSLLISAIYNGVTWVVFTLPLSAAGTSLFYRLTQFPADRRVF